MEKEAGGLVVVVAAAATAGDGDSKWPLPAPQGRTGCDLSSNSSLRKRSGLSLVRDGRWELLNMLLSNAQEVLFGTKLCPLFLVLPFAVAAHQWRLGQAWEFALSLISLVPLAERLSFLSEQIAYYAGPTVGGLLNATCGNVPELIIALLALQKDMIEVLKWSLLGSILSNLLLVLGSSLVFGGLANLNRELPFEQKQSDANLSLLMLASLCHIFALAYRYSMSPEEYALKTTSVLGLSRSCSILMLVAYFGCLFFQLKTHRQLFESQEDKDDDDNVIVSDAPAISFSSAFAWLIVTTALIAVLSDYVVNTIESASMSWGVSVSFITVILLPIVGNAAEHAAAIIFAFKNKIDIALGVSLGSSTQISMFLIPSTIIVAWVMGINMDLDFKLLETGSFIMSILVTTLILRDVNWHYMKGLVLCLCYFAIAAMFFVYKTPLNQSGVANAEVKPY